MKIKSPLYDKDGAEIKGGTGGGTGDILIDGGNASSTYGGTTDINAGGA